MPLQKLQFRPGLNREGTDYSNEGGWYDGDKIRFRSGFPEKIGGWIRFANATFVGVCRDLWNWVDLSGNNYIGLGTSKKYYIARGGSFYDVTPIYTTNTLTANPLSTQNTSNIITINDPNYTPNVGDYIIVSGATTFNGVTISGEYVVNSVPSAITYTIVASTNATNTGSGGGSAVVVQYELPSGLDVYTTGTGWGAGSWSPTILATLGANPFVTTNGSSTVQVTYTAHSLTTGNYVAFAGATTFASIPVGMINNTFAITVTGTNTFNITLPSGFTAVGSVSGGGSAVLVYPQYGTRGWGTAATIGVGSQLRLWSSDNFGQNLVIAPRGGAIYYWVDATGTSVRAQPLSTLSSAAGYSGAYVPTNTNQVLSSAIQRFVIAFGANSYLTGTPNTQFNPMLVRWSDQGNEFQWVPSITNQSGEFPLSNGSYIMGARATRQEILV